MPATAEGRIDHILNELIKAVWKHGRMLALPDALLRAIAAYLNSVRNRFAALAAKVRAGTLPEPRAPRPLPELSELPATPRVRAKLPRGFRWLSKLIPRHVSVYGSQLMYALTDPEVQVLLAAAPGLVRLLRPLLWALKQKPGPDLLPVLAKRTRRASKRPRQPRVSKSATIAAASAASGTLASEGPVSHSTPVSRSTPVSHSTPIPQTGPAPQTAPARWRTARPPGAGLIIFRG